MPSDKWHATQSAAPYGPACKEVILKNTGISGSETVIVGIREWQYPASNAWGWDLNGYLSWQAGTTWNVNSGDHGRTAYDATWEHFTQHPIMPLADDNMAYWIYSNKQRIVVVAKVSTHYEMCYLGFGKRFGSASEYPYPLAVIGSLWGNYSYTYEGAYHHFIVAPLHSTGSYYYNQFVVGPSNAYFIGKIAAISGSGADADINNNLASITDEVNKVITDIGTIETVVQVMDDAINNNFSDVVDEINKLRADVSDIRTKLIGAIDYADDLKTTVNALLAALRKTGGCGVLSD